MSRLKESAKEKKMKVMEEIAKADWLGLIVLHDALGIVLDWAVAVLDDEGRDTLWAKTSEANRAIIRRMIALRGHVSWAHDGRPDLGPVLERAVQKMVESTAERLWKEGEF